MLSLITNVSYHKVKKIDELQMLNFVCLSVCMSWGCVTDGQQVDDDPSIEKMKKQKPFFAFEK